MYIYPRELSSVGMDNAYYMQDPGFEPRHHKKKKKKIKIQKKKKKKVI